MKSFDYHMKEHPTYKGFFVTEEGEIYSKKGKMQGQFDKRGYLTYNLYGYGRKSGHRMVAETFIPNPNNLPQVNHIDEDKINNCVNNLEWISNEDNKHHSSFLWKILHIESGEVFTIKNIKKWARENNLSQGNLAGTLTGIRKQHKGYKVLEVSNHNQRTNKFQN